MYRVKRKLLVVDDVKINVDIICAILQTEDIEVIVAYDGAKALELFKSKGDIDMIFMDIQMPVMDGYEATRLIRNEEKDKEFKIPIIFVSSNPYGEVIDMARKVGMTDFIAKPVNKKVILDIINHYI